MSSMRDDALLILRFMVEQGANLVHRSLTARDIQDNLGLSDVEFSCADQYLLNSGYIKGTGRGLEGTRRITPSGIDFLHYEQRQMIQLSLTAEKIARFLFKKNIHKYEAGLSEIQTVFKLAADDCQNAVQELIDKDLARDSAPAGNIRQITQIELTAKGRNAVRNNFCEPTPTLQQSVGAIFNAPVYNSNVLAVAQAHQSRIQQVIEAKDITGLRDEIGQMLEQLVEAVKSELETNQLVVYEKAAKDLQAETNKDEPNPSLLRKCLNVLNVADTLDGTIEFGKKAMELSLKVAPLIHLLQQAIVGLLQ